MGFEGVMKFPINEVAEARMRKIQNPKTAEIKIPEGEVVVAFQPVPEVQGAELPKKSFRQRSEDLMQGVDDLIGTSYERYKAETGSEDDRWEVTANLSGMVISRKMKTKRFGVNLVIRETATISARGAAGDPYGLFSYSTIIDYKKNGETRQVRTDLTDRQAVLAKSETLAGELGKYLDKPRAKRPHLNVELF